MSDTKKAGRPPANPGAEILRFNAALTKANNRKLKMIAADKGVTPSEVLNQWIEAAETPKL